MTKAQIKIIAQKSFIRNQLDSKKVKFFTSKMKRRELRNYIRELKSIDSKNKITVVVPSIESFKKSDISSLSEIYIGKKIVYQEDPSLMVGLKLIDNDLIYDFNLKNSFDNMIEEIEKYDN